MHKSTLEPPRLLKTTRCLIIDEPFINLILDKRKTWEIRRRNTNIRERIALGNKKKRCAVGYAKIVDCREMSVKELKKYNSKHRANDFLDKYANGRKTLFVWVLEEVESDPNPKPYSYSTGSWCKVD